MSNSSLMTFYKLLVASRKKVIIFINIIYTFFKNRFERRTFNHFKQFKEEIVFGSDEKDITYINLSKCSGMFEKSLYDAEFSKCPIS